MEQAFSAGQGEAVILISHTHWDHILGFPFFTPFYRQGNRFVIASAGQTGSHIRDILAGQHADLNFPVPFEDLVADFEYISFEPGDKLELGDFYIETVQLNHPGITVGFRIEADGCSATVYTDTGRVRQVRVGEGMGGPSPDETFTNAYLEQLAHCARKSDILVHDTQFREYEMVGRYNWGHSTVEDALEMARMAGVKQLALFHYDPNHSDTVVDEQLALARDLSVGDTFEMMAAAEGWQLEMGSGEELL
jgi:ribonuclease BN (tRNA processing enzyme)